MLYLIDGSRAPAEDEFDEAERLCKALKESGRDGVLVVVQNKSDLGTHAEASGMGFALGVSSQTVSALTGDGLEALEVALEQQLLRGAGPERGAVFTRRQKRHLKALHAGLEESLDAVEVIGHIRALVGTRPNEEELAAVFREAAND